MRDDVKAAAERLLNEVKIHVAEYGGDSIKPGFTDDIKTVANAALAQAAALAETRGQAERMREALDIVQRCNHDRLQEISGDCTTYEDAFRRLEIACAAMSFSEDIARAAVSSAPGATTTREGRSREEKRRQALDSARRMYAAAIENLLPPTEQAICGNCDRRGGSWQAISHEPTCPMVMDDS